MAKRLCRLLMSILPNNRENISYNDILQKYVLLTSERETFQKLKSPLYS